MGSPRVQVSKTPELLATLAADEFVATFAGATRDRGRFAVALSGGRTPRAMLETLAARPIDWSLVHFFWSDERCVGPDDPNSNYRMARAALLSRVPAVVSNDLAVERVWRRVTSPVDRPQNVGEVGDNR